MQDVLLQYGALGVLAMVGILAAKIMFDRLNSANETLREYYQNEKARADRLEEELKQLNQTMRTDYVTVLNSASQAMLDANRAVGMAMAAIRQGP